MNAFVKLSLTILLFSSIGYTYSQNKSSQYWSTLDTSMDHSNEFVEVYYGKTPSNGALGYGLVIAMFVGLLIWQKIIIIKK